MKKFYLIIICGFSFSFGIAQTAIDPVSVGGFDNGNSFALNGWTVVNGSGNKWVVGTGASTIPPSTPNTAYISADGDPAHYSYDNTKAHISHFYKLITLPANAFNLQLTFYLKGNLQSDENGLPIDGFQIYADPTLTAPVGDALPGPNAFMEYYQTGANNNYTPIHITIDSYLANQPVETQFYLIFTWVNNNDNIGAGPPASIDGISLTYCIKSPTFTVTGGGAYCAGGSGVGIGLNGSTAGIKYQLYKNGSALGNPLDGTGAALDFGPQKAGGPFTVVGTSECGSIYPMNGSAIVIENPLPIVTIGSNSPLCLGSTLNLTSSGGTTYNWIGPNGFTSNLQNPSVSNFSGDKQGNYMVTVTNDKACSASASTTVSVISGGAVGGSVSSALICSGSSGSLSLTGNSNAPVRWESTTDSSSSSWTHISNTTTTINYSNITVPTFYRAVVTEGCGETYSDTGSVSIRNYWIGIKSNDWNNAANWSGNTLPGVSCSEVFIPAGSPRFPVLNTLPKATIKNLHIAAAASVTVSDAGLLQIAGNIDNLGTLDISAGTLELNGSGSPQNIDGSIFSSRTIKNLVISNAVQIGSEANDTLKISGTLSFGTATATVNTGNNLTLKSTVASTANIGIMAAGNNITGNVTVERYINVGKTAGFHGKSWQLVATPTRGQSVFDSWMESGHSVVGYGTQITGVGGSANGFDLASPPALKYYDYNTDDWIGVTKTSDLVYNQKGYMLFVRGDRTTTFPNVSNTTLRTTGKVFTPIDPPPITTVTGGHFESVGNPYASAIDMRKITLSNVTNAFYVWDPTLGGEYGVGAYVTLAQTGSDDKYYPTPPTGMYINGTYNIESGQAFFVHASGAADGHVSFTESDKVNGSTVTLRNENLYDLTGRLEAELYAVSGDSSKTLQDGNLILFNTGFSDKLDGLDVQKRINSGGNFGILLSGKNLVIERRSSLEETDTIFYSLTGLVKGKYRVGFTARGLAGFGQQGFVLDNYLQTKLALTNEGVTNIDFIITADPASYAPGRLMIVFKEMKALPLQFVYVEAYQKAKQVNVSWKVENQNDILYYEVEKSRDGKAFISIGKENASGSVLQAQYQLSDSDIINGYYYYRIRSFSRNGMIAYSKIANVLVASLDGEITIYPNPVTDGLIHLHLVNQVEGRYFIRLVDNVGQVLMQKVIYHPEGSSTELIPWDYKRAHGMYFLEVRKPDVSVVRLNIMY